MESLANTIRKMRTAQRAPVQQPSQIVEQPHTSNSQEFDYAAETATEETRLIQAPSKPLVVAEDHQGVSPMTEPSPEVFAAAAARVRQGPRPDIPPLIESDVTRYMRPKARAIPLPTAPLEPEKPLVTEEAVTTTNQSEVAAKKFKSVKEYTEFQRNRRAQNQLKIIDNA